MSCRFRSANSVLANGMADEFENIAEDYRKFSQHQIPGSLKVCLVTEFGRSQK